MTTRDPLKSRLGVIEPVEGRPWAQPWKVTLWDGSRMMRVERAGSRAHAERISDAFVYEDAA